MFGWLKNPFSKKEDYSDIKSHVLGDFSRPSERPGFDSLQSGFQKPAFGQVDPSLKPMSDFRRDSFNGPYAPARRDIDDEFAPPRRGILSDDDLSIGTGSGKFEKKLDVDKIVNTLLLIKEQLAAIKAQNEMINERLKNLERIADSESY